MEIIVSDVFFGTNIGDLDPQRKIEYQLHFLIFLTINNVITLCRISFKLFLYISNTIVISNHAYCNPCLQNSLVLVCVAILKHKTINIMCIVIEYQSYISYLYHYSIIDYLTCICMFLIGRINMGLQKSYIQNKKIFTIQPIYDELKCFEYHDLSPASAK